MKLPAFGVELVEEATEEFLVVGVASELFDVGAVLQLHLPLTIALHLVLAPDGRIFVVSTEGNKNRQATALLLGLTSGVHLDVAPDLTAEVHVAWVFTEGWLVQLVRDIHHLFHVRRELLGVVPLVTLQGIATRSLAPTCLLAFTLGVAPIVLGPLFNLGCGRHTLVQRTFIYKCEASIITPPPVTGREKIIPKKIVVCERFKPEFV